MARVFIQYSWIFLKHWRNFHLANPKLRFFLGAGRSKLQRFDGMTCCKISPGFRPQLWGLPGFSVKPCNSKLFGPIRTDLTKSKVMRRCENPCIIIISLNLYFLHVSNGLSWSTVIKCRSQWQQLGKKLWIFDVLHRPDLWRMQNHCSGTVTVELLMFAYAGMPQNASRFLLTSWSVVSTFFNCAGHKVVFCLSQEGQDGHQFCVRHRNQRST